jgi:hypothetical protein
MGQWTTATWRKGKRTITGSWYYEWARDLFHIRLDRKCRFTGDTIQTTVSGDHPEFNGWKLVKEKPRK